MKFRRGGWGAIYIVWILLCATLALLMAGAEDPSRRRDRIPQRAAAERALQTLRDLDWQRYRSYQIVHIAWARAGEIGREPRWLVLCDTVPRSGLRQAVVVEIGGRDGKSLGVRPPR